jgi:hypothetical protein
LFAQLCGGVALIAEALKLTMLVRQNEASRAGDRPPDAGNVQLFLADNRLGAFEPLSG